MKNLFSALEELERIEFNEELEQQVGQVDPDLAEEYTESALESLDRFDRMVASAMESLDHMHQYNEMVQKTISNESVSLSAAGRDRIRALSSTMVGHYGAAVESLVLTPEEGDSVEELQEAVEKRFQSLQSATEGIVAEIGKGLRDNVLYTFRALSAGTGAIQKAKRQLDNVADGKHDINIGSVNKNFCYGYGEVASTFKDYLREYKRSVETAGSFATSAADIVQKDFMGGVKAFVSAVTFSGKKATADFREKVEKAAAAMKKVDKFTETEKRKDRTVESNVPMLGGEQITIELGTGVDTDFFRVFTFNLSLSTPDDFKVDYGELLTYSDVGKKEVSELLKYVEVAGNAASAHRSFTGIISQIGGLNVVLNSATPRAVAPIAVVSTISRSYRVYYATTIMILRTAAKSLRYIVEQRNTGLRVANKYIQQAGGN